MNNAIIKLVLRQLAPMLIGAALGAGGAWLGMDLKKEVCNSSGTVLKPIIGFEQKK